MTQAANSRTMHMARLVTHKTVQKQRKPRGNYTPDEHQWGQIAAIHVGPPAVVDVWLSGTQNTKLPENLTQNVKYLHPYIPTVGDVVLVHRGFNRKRTSHVVLGKLYGSASPYPLPLGSVDSEGRYVSNQGAIYGGAEPPPINLGENGDWYHATTSATIYQKNNNTWGSYETSADVTEADIAAAIPPGPTGNVMTSTGAGWVSEPAEGGGGSITDITCTDSSVVITDPTGPTVTLSAPGAYVGGEAVGTLTANQYLYFNGSIITTVAGSGGGATSVSNSDGTLTISPTTGAVVASRAALTGDVTCPTGSNTTVVAAIQGTTIASPPGGTTQFLRGDGNWAVPPGSGGGAVSSVSAGDASVVITPTTGAVVVESGTLDQIANLHPPAANWSNNSQKITGLLAGTASTHAANVGQIPVVTGGGYGITGATGLTPTPVIGLTSNYTTLPGAADFTIPTTSALQTALTTPSLAIGTWLITGQITISGGTTIGDNVWYVLQSSGTAVISGTAPGAQLLLPTGTATENGVTMPISGLLVVTTAGTFDLDTRTNSAGTVKAKYALSASPFTLQATFVICTRIA